jgi:outer membrane murein-binding lipoprotein Lpp
MDTVTWTDDKLDVLNDTVETLDGKVDTLEKKVDAGFARAEIEYVRTDERFKAVGERFDEVNRQLWDLKTGQAQMIDRFAAMQRTLVQVGFSLVVGLLGGLVALIAVVLTH